LDQDIRNAEEVIKNANKLNADSAKNEIDEATNAIKITQTKLDKVHPNYQSLADAIGSLKSNLFTTSKENAETHLFKFAFFNVKYEELHNVYANRR